MDCIDKKLFIEVAEQMFSTNGQHLNSLEQEAATLRFEEWFHCHFIFNTWAMDHRVSDKARKTKQPNPASGILETNPKEKRLSSSEIVTPCNRSEDAEMTAIVYDEPGRSVFAVLRAEG